MKTIQNFVAGMSLAVLLALAAGIGLAPTDALANISNPVTNCLNQCRCFTPSGGTDMVCLSTSVSGCKGACTCVIDYMNPETGIVGPACLIN